MKLQYIASLFIALACFACTPKTGEKATATAPAAAGKAPVIPIPEGDVRKSAPKAGAAPSIQIGKAETFTLANGLKVIVVENHKLPRVSYRVFVDYDPIMEKDAIGYVDMMGELLAKGTTARTKAQIDEAVDFLGASMGSDANGISGSCLTKYSDKLLEIMSEVLLRPAFAAEELEKSKKQAESNLLSAKDDPAAISTNVSSILRYGKSHPYGEVMTEQTLANVTQDKIKNHYNTFFKPNISYLVITGDITRAQAEKQANKYFGKWVKGDVPKQQYFAPRPPEKTQVNFVHKPGAVQSVINITYPLDLKPGDPDAIKARLLNTILGGYFNSRVNANLREKHGWTYGARTSLGTDKLVGYFNANASVRNAVTDSSIIQFVKEMERLRTEKVPAEELQTVKNVLTGQFSSNLEEPGTVAQFALNVARYGLPANYYETYLANLQSISAAEVVYLAKKYLTPERAHILVVGNKDDVTERLKQFSPTGEIQYYDAFGNPVKPAGEAVPAGMTAEKVIQDYINAIGGADKIAAVKDMQTTSVLRTPGPTLDVKTIQKGGDKIVVEVTMNQQVVTKQVLNGDKGTLLGGGPSAKPEPISGTQLNDLKEQALFFKEAGYLKGGYKLELQSIEDANGVKAYKIEVVRPDGKKSTEFYDIKTGLKVREESTVEGPQGTISQATDINGYEAVNGVKIPRTLISTGLLPMPVKINISEVLINKGVEDSLFQL
jgi:zinc protease